jgi:hypothetical protein
VGNPCGGSSVSSAITCENPKGILSDVISHQTGALHPASAKVVDTRQLRLRDQILAKSLELLHFHICYIYSAVRFPALKLWKKCGNCDVGGGKEEEMCILFAMKVLTKFAVSLFAKSR